MNGFQEQSPYSYEPAAGQADDVPMLDRQVSRRGFLRGLGLTGLATAVTSCGVEDPWGMEDFHHINEMPYQFPNDGGPDEEASPETLPGQVNEIRKQAMAIIDYVADMLDAQSSGSGVPWGDQQINGEWVARDSSGSLRSVLRYREIDKGYEIVTAEINDTRGQDNLRLTAVVYLAGGVDRKHGERLSRVMRDPSRVVPHEVGYKDGKTQGGVKTSPYEINTSYPEVEDLYSLGDYGIDDELIASQSIFDRIRR